MNVADVNGENEPGHVDLSELRDDGDVVKLDDERTLRLRFETDQDASINDYDSDGRVEWTRRNDYGAVRPADFDGSARIIDTDYPHNLWWQPPGLEITGTAWDAATMRTEEARIRDLVRFGFKGVVLELCNGTDAYGRPVVEQVASLWGIEWDCDDAYLATIVSDLASELAI